MLKKEIADYLTNFWDHEVGSTVKDIGGRVLFISKIDEEDSCQVQLSDSCKWFFIQDLEWFPSLDEAMLSVCKKLNINVYNDSLQYNKIIKQKPSTFEELYDIITDIRSSILIQ